MTKTNKHVPAIVAILLAVLSRTINNTTYNVLIRIIGYATNDFSRFLVGIYSNYTVKVIIILILVKLITGYKKQVAIRLSICVAIAEVVGTFLYDTKFFTFFEPQNRWLVEGLLEPILRQVFFVLMILVIVYFETIFRAKDISRYLKKDAILLSVIIGVGTGIMIINSIWVIGSNYDFKLIAEFPKLIRSVCAGIVLYQTCFIWECFKKYVPNGMLSGVVLIVMMEVAAVVAYFSGGDRTFLDACGILLWTPIGLLLYDLGCFVAERIRKKLAKKKQGSLEETAEA